MNIDKVSEFIGSDAYTPMTIKKIAEAVGAEESELPQLSELLGSLEENGSLITGKKNRYFRCSDLGLVRGVLRVNSRGFGFVSSDDEEIYIADCDMNGALNGDTVLVRPVKSAKKGRGREGEIIRVLVRAKQTVVGIYKQERGYGLVVPDNERLPREMFVAPRDSGNALNGQKVVADIISYETETSSLQCRITEVLGFPYDFGVDMLSILKTYGFGTDFPKKALDEAETLSLPEQSELEGRLDLTDKIIITIDGDDTKDIDDAVSVEKTLKGYRLGVHIADVSHYVRPGTPLDCEAFSRGTSVYLADRVVPMLPFRLSNDLCSLNEGVLRLTMSAIMDIDNRGNITDAKFYRSFIKSAARMTYNNVRLLLTERPPELCARYAGILPSLELMRSLARILNKKTHSRGAIDFNIPEAKAVLDENGKTVDIVLRKTDFSNNIIEEFMIAANSSVAKFLDESGVSSVFRVHGEPDKQKLDNVRKFVYNLGCSAAAEPAEIMRHFKGTSQETAVSAMLLRSMAKAMYSGKNDGHYGLMLEDYCHFTSPIRRYPDLICHRALKAAIDKDKKALKYLSGFVQSAAEQSSEREQAAQMCERDALDAKKAEYMQAHIGEDFEGIISSVTGFGFFVMLPNTIEGLVRLELLKDDYYVYDDVSLSLTGERSGKRLSIGMSVSVKLVAADKESRKIDFILFEGGTGNGGKRKDKNARTKQKRSSRLLHRRKNRSRH